MTTESLPNTAEVDASIKLIEDNATRIFTWDYERDRAQLVTLYNKAMSSQWNSVTDLDWQIDVDPERLVREMGDDAVPSLFRVAARLPGSPLATWKEPEFTQLGVELMKARLSQFMHGEQGAMMVAAKIVETVPWIDAKYYASTQTMDEARHTEVFAKYIDTKLGGAYPMSPFLEEQITVLIQDSRWDSAYLGMQIVFESLALAAFGELHRTTTEPLLKKLLRYVMSDEARHVAFGVLTLGELYAEMSSPELQERAEFAFEAAVRMRDRFLQQEVWERLGVDPKKAIPFVQQSPLRAEFQKMLFTKIVPNCKKLGLLDANEGWLRQRFTEIGVIEYENLTDTGEEYDTFALGDEEAHVAS